MSPRRNNPAPLHPSNTPEALEHLAPFEPWPRRSFPLPEGFQQLNGGQAVQLPPHTSVRDLPLARVPGRAAMTAEPPNCPRPRRGSSADGLRVGGARERTWEAAQERGPLLREVGPIWIRGAEQGQEELPVAGMSLSSHASDAGVSVGSPWSSLMDGLSESDFDPTTLLLNLPPPAPQSPSLFSLLLDFLRRLLGCLFSTSHPAPALLSPTAAADLRSLESGEAEMEIDSDDDFIVEHANPWSD